MIKENPAQFSCSPSPEMLTCHIETVGWIPWTMGNHCRFVSMKMIQWEPCFRHDGKPWELWPGYSNQGKGEAGMSSNLSSEQKSRWMIIRAYLGEVEVEDTKNALLAPQGQHSPWSRLFVQSNVSPHRDWSQVSLNSLTCHAVSHPSKPLQVWSLLPKTMMKIMTMTTDARCSLCAYLRVFFFRKKPSFLGIVLSFSHLSLGAGITMEY